MASRCATSRRSGAATKPCRGTSSLLAAAPPSLAVGAGHNVRPGNGRVTKMSLCGMFENVPLRAANCSLPAYGMCASKQAQLTQSPRRRRSQECQAPLPCRWVPTPGPIVFCCSSLLALTRSLNIHHQTTVSLFLCGRCHIDGKQGVRKISAVLATCIALFILGEVPITTTELQPTNQYPSDVLRGWDSVQEVVRIVVYANYRCRHWNSFCSTLVSCYDDKRVQRI